MQLTPKQIVEFLDEYVIGQDSAKKTIAIALRNRWRRMQLNKELQDEIIPKNILMIGSTGIGKTEIARRLSKLFGLPFIKVEASKYTEVGFVGRDVESMIRDLALASLNLVKAEHRAKNEENINRYIEERILEALLPKLPSGANEQKQESHDRLKSKMLDKLKSGELDHSTIELDIAEKGFEASPALPPEMANMQDSVIKLIGIGTKKVKKEIKVKDAKNALLSEACEHILDDESIKNEALNRAQNEGIIFIDEIDKVAVSSTSSNRQDPSKEGVQRDLLPIVEGSTVATKIGAVKTDHILFIAAGAFHISKPSDLIAELQGRFPLRVSLDSLDEDALLRILTTPKNSLIEQYKALLKTEGVELIFEESALKQIAKLAFLTNQNIEDIGARRLHAVLENVLEDASFNASENPGKAIITADLVADKIGSIATNSDLAKYIL